MIARTMVQECLTTSIGMASCPLNGRNEAELVSAADTALYRAKRKGGNCVIVARAPEEAPGGEATV